MQPLSPIPRLLPARASSHYHHQTMMLRMHPAVVAHTVHTTVYITFYASFIIDGRMEPNTVMVASVRVMLGGFLRDFGRLPDLERALPNRDKHFQTPKVALDLHVKKIILCRVGVLRFRTLERWPMFSDGPHIDRKADIKDLEQVNNPEFRFIFRINQTL